MTKSPMERFVENLRYDEDTGCHLWTSYTDKPGYPLFFADGKKHRAARWIYEQRHGPIPVGLEMSHVCNRRACVRIHPDHVRAETRAENMARRDYRDIMGPKNGNAKLSEREVAAIRELYEIPFRFSVKRLGRMFDISKRSAYYVINYETYENIIPPTLRQQMAVEAVDPRILLERTRNLRGEAAGAAVTPYKR